MSDKSLHGSTEIIQKPLKWDTVAWLYFLSPYVFFFCFSYAITELNYFKCGAMNWKTYIFPCTDNGTLFPTEVVKDLIFNTEKLHEKLIHLNAVKQYRLPQEYNPYFRNLINETIVQITKNEYNIETQLKIIQKCVIKNVKNNSCIIYATCMGFFFSYFTATILVEIFVHYFYKWKSARNPKDFNVDVEGVKYLTRIFTIPCNFLLFIVAFFEAHMFPYFSYYPYYSLKKEDFLNTC